VAGVQGASASGLSGRAIARELAAGIVADYSREQERGVACFMDDFEACIAHLRFLVTHRRAIRTINLL
jgi:putative transposase